MNSHITVSAILIKMGLRVSREFQGVRSPLWIVAPKVVNWSSLVKMDADEDVVCESALVNIAMSRNLVCRTHGTTLSCHLSGFVYTKPLP